MKGRWYGDLRSEPSGVVQIDERFQEHRRTGIRLTLPEPVLRLAQPGEPVPLGTGLRDPPFPQSECATCNAALRSEEAQKAHELEAWMHDVLEAIVAARKHLSAAHSHLYPTRGVEIAPGEAIDALRLADDKLAALLPGAERLRSIWHPGRRFP